MAEYDDGRGKHFTKWFIGLMLGIPLLCGGCGVLGFLFLRSESPYDQAVERATNHARVNKVLGAPVTAASLFSGQMNTTGDDGLATMEIELSGSKQTGTLHVKGVQTSGLWGFSTLKLVARDGTVINLLGY
ncbi:cytochrome c oxidase assembly factor 1 family protein [Archangium lipolyticum]|uniref:cytochrome c oxidase assembly factor 1 family protein n=1 Tax=Archangium lipolyticum TaxID=2970465 RepID=UPI0021499F9E|nr:cytochrome c oxidase assembly factor 1 family protein [Archangium lipolyticum]